MLKKFFKFSAGSVQWDAKQQEEEKPVDGRDENGTWCCLQTFHLKTPSFHWVSWRSAKYILVSQCVASFNINQLWWYTALHGSYRPAPKDLSTKEVHAEISLPHFTNASVCNCPSVDVLLNVRFILLQNQSEAALFYIPGPRFCHENVRVKVRLYDMGSVCLVFNIFVYIWSQFTWYMKT